MALSDFEAKYQNAVINLIKNQEAIIQGYAGNHIALVNQRLEAEGTDYKGKKFPLYSTEPLPLFYFDKPTNRASAVRSFEKKVSDKKAVSSYREWRAHNGLPVDRRTFVFTGDMLSSLRAETTVKGDFVIEVVITAPDSFNKNKIKWNSSSVASPILKASDEEREILKKAFLKDIQKYLPQ